MWWSILLSLTHYPLHISMDIQHDLLSRYLKYFLSVVYFNLSYIYICLVGLLLFYFESFYFCFNLLLQLCIKGPTKIKLLLFCASHIVADHWSTESLRSYWRSSGQPLHWPSICLIVASQSWDTQLYLNVWSHPEMKRWKHNAAGTSAVLSHKHCVFVHHMCLRSLNEQHNCHPKSCYLNKNTVTCCSLKMHSKCLVYI